MILRSRRLQGFTTLEIILVVALLSLIVVAIAPFFRTIVTGWELKDRQLEILQNGRVGMDEMVKIIKTARQFTTTDASYIRFIDADNDDIRYRLQSGVLQKRKTGSWWNALAEPAPPLSFTELSFTYYDRNGDETSEPTQVRSVKIAMEISDSEGKVSQATFNSQVTPRKDYLIYRLAINEINYNPPGGGAAEYRREWVELYNYGTTAIDLTGWRIRDSARTDNLQPANGTMTIPGGGYAIITAIPTDVYTYYIVAPGAVKLRVGDSRIGNGLGDSSDIITILNSDGDVIESVIYDDDWGGDGNGDTIERKGPQSSEWEASSVVGTYTAGSVNSVSP